MSPGKKKVILDTSVILNLFERVVTKKDIFLEFLFAQFDFYTTPTVIEEATRSNKSSIDEKFLKTKLSIIDTDYNIISFEQLREMNEKLDAGEVSMLISCLKSGYIGSTDDMGAIKYGRKLGIKNFGTIVLLKYAYDSESITTEEASSMISEMRQKGAHFKDMLNMDFEAYYKKYLK